MQICLLLFAAHREAVGQSRLELEVPPGATADDVYASLEGQHPGLIPLRPYTTFAVNREIVPPTRRLSPADEVAFLQPVSGG